MSCSLGSHTSFRSRPVTVLSNVILSPRSIIPLRLRRVERLRHFVHGTERRRGNRRGRLAVGVQPVVASHHICHLAGIIGIDVVIHTRSISYGDDTAAARNLVLLSQTIIIGVEALVRASFHRVVCIQRNVLEMIAAEILQRRHLSLQHRGVRLRTAVGELLGISTSYVSSIERGKRGASGTLLKKMHDTFMFSYDYMLGTSASRMAEGAAVVREDAAPYGDANLSSLLSSCSRQDLDVCFRLCRAYLMSKEN